MCCIAEAVGVNMPVARTMVELSNIMNENNYWINGITLAKLGLEGMSKEDMLKYVNNSH